MLTPRRTLTTSRRRRGWRLLIRTIEGEYVDEWNNPFLNALQDRIGSTTLRTRLATVASRHRPAVIMLDLASEMLAGASMAEISTVLYVKVMQ